MDNSDSVRVFFRGFVVGYVASYIGIPTTIMLMICYICILYAQATGVDISGYLASLYLMAFTKVDEAMPAVDLKKKPRLERLWNSRYQYVHNSISWMSSISSLFLETERFAAQAIGHTIPTSPNKLKTS